jgi:integrase
LTSLDSLEKLVRHARDCPKHLKSKDKTPACTCGVKATKCTCQPSYFTFYTDRDEKPVRGSRVKNRRVAETALRKLQVELDENRAGVARPKNSTFNDWLPRWKQKLELDTWRRPSTVRAYMTSGRLFAESCGNYDLREITNDEMEMFVRACRERGNDDRTLDKHLRHLSSCFKSAIGSKLLEQNPVTVLRDTFHLKLEPVKANFFTDGELQKLWRQFDVGVERDGRIVPVAPVYLYLSRFAVATGARIGELAALTFADIDLDAGDHGEISINKSWSQEDGLGPPKTKFSIRTIHMIGSARRVLDEWTPILRQLRGHQAIDDDALVFPNEDGNHMSQSNVANRVVNPIMAAAGIPKVGPESPEERSFHTFRHCYARLMLQPRRDADGNTIVLGQPLRWVSSEMGHRDTATTERIYGHWAEEANRDVAALIPDFMPV